MTKIDEDHAAAVLAHCEALTGIKKGIPAKAKKAHAAKIVKADVAKAFPATGVVEKPKAVMPFVPVEETAAAKAKRDKATDAKARKIMETLKPVSGSPGPKVLEDFLNKPFRDLAKAKAKAKGSTKIPYAGKENGRGITSPAPKAVDNDLAQKIAAAPQPLPKGTKVDGIDVSGMTDDPKATGIPVYLQVQNRKALTKAQEKAIADIKKKADAAKAKATNVVPMKAKTAKPEKKAKPEKTAKPRKPADRSRYDWNGAREAAEKGKVPAAPDFSANTHRYYRPMLAEVEKLVKARDLGGLQAYRVKGTCTSPNAIKKYREIAIVALKAKKG